ncbi:NAD-dependent epimerase/dehydratase family protein [Marinitenerispora sediminis]|uniref:Epimerase n=1 Tax=Marinitenerispora sediminis TaxID=1931232 RepID=A0A368T556_9ACTN|nr:NAD-dependent epimerase/dehydratase family protein [Marinitenerispora sediminis]RCV47607.1 epimerase [Marinitenerispora sediminis]RCV47961.1 epimerase [Marinitenerispora sediminis]RCV58600.1 epimerase [Marinitenerispora sediminis]
MELFVTGATGYIGGSVAAGLIENGHRVRGLTRSAEQAERLRAHGVEPVVGALDDLALLTREAERADAVVNAADSDHHGAVAALAAALTGTGKALLHTSGSSIAGDDARGGPPTGDPVDESVHDPGSTWRPTPDKAARVAIDRFVRAAAGYGVRSAVICNTLIYGRGRGVHPDSIQVPALARQAAASGVPRHVGAGENVWSTVHIDDVVDLYLRALDRAPAGAFYFAENGEAAFADITAAVAERLGLGRPQRWSVEEAAAEWGYEHAVYALGSNSRVRGPRARRELGWAPRHGSVLDWVRTEMPVPAAR